MILHEPPGSPKYYCFDNLSRFSGLVHGVFTRIGGSSDLNFKSLNVGLATGDEKDRVVLNRKMVAMSMGADEENAIYLNQVHGKEFFVIKSDAEIQPVESESKNSVSQKNYPETNLPKKDADGIITNTKGVLTVMQVADCQAVILYDPVNKVIANIHSGWRGSLLNIIGRGVEIMVENFYTNPADIFAAIAPSLGPCCSEFKNYRDEIPEYFWKYRVVSKNNENHFDFWKMSSDQLTDKGVLPQNIEVAGVCTPCTSHLFYSYRKESITGRFAVAAMLL